MTGRSIRTRLTAAYLAVLAAATVTLAAGAWVLLRQSIVVAADAALETRVRGVAQFIDAAQRGLSPEDLHDEFGEFAELTGGETLLEVVDTDGAPFTRPSLAGWEQLRVPASSLENPAVVASVVNGQPYRAVTHVLTVLDHRYVVHVAVPLATEFAALRSFGWLLAAMVPAVLLVAGAGGFWLSGRALGPVDRMTRDAQSISVHQLGRRLEEPKVDDELRRLARTFNDMLARLQASVADMARFTSDAAHELRTPVTLTRATAELALSRERTAGEYRQALDEVLRYAEQMSGLVDDLLALARADAGVDSAPAADVDLRGVIADTLRAVELMSRARGQRLRVDLSEAPVTVRADARALRRLFLIPLDNAIRYTPSNGDVSVRLSTSDDDAGGAMAIVEIDDTGPGVPEADRAHVFDRFFRGMRAREAAPEGSGLGLAIARTIVERLGGAIALDDGPAGGCRVRITLPCRPALARDTHASFATTSAAS